MKDVQGFDDSAYTRAYVQGQRIGGDAQEMYIVVSGSVDAFEVAQGRLKPLGTRMPGQSFAEREFFWGGTENVFRAREATTVYVISEASWDDFARSEPKVLFAIMKSLCAPENAQELEAEKRAAEQQERATPKAEPVIVKGKEGSGVPAASSDFFPEGHKGYPGIVHPEYRQFVYDKEYKCPLCAQTFKAPRIYQSKLVNSAPIRYDMRESFNSFQIEWYDIVTCPHCYFCMLSTHFADPKNFLKLRAKEAIKDVKSRVQLDFSVERDLDFVLAAHYLALLSAGGYVNARQLTAKLWSNLSWLYEDAEDKAMEVFAAGNAARAYETLFMETTMSPGQEQVVCLTCAGMLYRAGEFADIKKWLFNVRTNKEGKRLYADLAEDLMAMIKGE